jgi:hypothetical protein
VIIVKRKRGGKGRQKHKVHSEHVLIDFRVHQRICERKQKSIIQVGKRLISVFTRASFTLSIVRNHWRDLSREVMGYNLCFRESSTVQEMIKRLAQRGGHPAFQQPEQCTAGQL